MRRIKQRAAAAVAMLLVAICGPGAEGDEPRFEVPEHLLRQVKHAKQKYQRNPTRENQTQVTQAQRAVARKQAARRKSAADGAGANQTDAPSGRVARPRLGARSAPASKSAPRPSNRPSNLPSNLPNRVPDQDGPEIPGRAVPLPPGTTMPTRLPLPDGAATHPRIELPSLNEILERLGQPGADTLPELIDFDGTQLTGAHEDQLQTLLKQLDNLNRACIKHNNNPPRENDAKAVDEYCQAAINGNKAFDATRGAIHDLLRDAAQQAEQQRKRDRQLRNRRKRR